MNATLDQTVKNKGRGGTEGRRLVDGGNGRPGGCAFREGAGRQTGAALCTWTARAGRHDPVVWTQPKKKLAGGVWLWSGDAELEVSGVTDMEIPGRGPAGRLHPRSLNRELRVSCKDGR